MADIELARQRFGEAGLGFPTIPEPLAAAIVSQTNPASTSTLWKFSMTKSAGWISKPNSSPTKVARRRAATEESTPPDIPTIILFGIRYGGVTL